MPSVSSRFASRRARRPGFALIIALVLMGLLVLLMASLSTLVRVDLHSSDLGARQQLARQNALLGLKIALAELQNTAGYDQRVTARADITSDTAVANPHWTGVWKSVAPVAAPALAPVVPSGAGDLAAANSSLVPSRAELVNWLVSGNESRDATAANAPAHSPADGLREFADFGQDADKEAVYLVGASTLVQRGSGEAASAAVAGAVVAPKVALSGSGNDKIGHYAWWVGDEGIKARVQYRQTPAGLGKTAAENTGLAFQLPAASDPAAITGLEAFFDRTDEGLSGILDYDSLHMAIAAGDEGAHHRALNEQWHTLSPFSRGLLTDTRWGGFRGDLTLAFERPDIFTNYFGNWSGNSDNFYFVDLGDFSQYDAKFLNWSNLREFYALKDRTGVSGGATPAFLANPLETAKSVYAQPETSPYRNAASGDRREGYHGNSPLHPLISRLQVTVGMRYVPSGTLEDGKPLYDPVLLIKPLTGVYNPYNITLNAVRSNADGSGDIRNHQIRWSFRPLFRITAFDKDGNAKPGAPVEFYLREVLGSTATAPDQLMQDLLLQHPYDNRQLLPGETRLYGLWDDVTRASFNGTGSSANRVMLKTGAPDAYDPESGFLVLSLNDVFEASASGRQGDVPNKSPQANFGLSADEKAYLRIRDDEYFQLEIDTSAPGGIWSTLNAGVTGMNQSNNFHLQYFNPVAENSIIAGSIPSRDTGRIPVGTAVVPAPDTPGALDNLVTWGFWMRGANDSLARSRLLVDHNIRAMGGPQGWDEMNNNFYMSSVFTGEFEGDQLYGYIEDPLANIFNDGNPRFTGFWGGSASSAFGGVDRVVLFDVPRTPLISLGALQHANIGRYTIDPSYIVGNSFPPSRLRDLRQIYGSGYIRSDIDIWDLSYLLNQQLWDSYYFSTIPQSLTDTNVRQLLSGEAQLPNHRLRLIDHGGAVSVDELTAGSGGSGNADNSFYDVASHLLVEGAFNINSTSEEAWAALLASSRDLQIPRYGLDSGSYSGTEQERDTVFSRLLHPVGERSDGSGATFWHGYRVLSEQQVRDLAGAIVELIRERGKPFASLAEFVNRPLEQAPATGKARPGLLQEAIERAGINSSAPGDTLSGVASPPGISHNQINNTEATVGFPGYLTQADILQTLGPLLSARSDTFRIRSYGDVIDPRTSQVQARAWCEAVVQRIPHEVLGGGDYLSRSANRKFQIISFRWLDQDEI